MKRTWTIIAVRDVALSTTFYQSLFGQPLAPPSHDHFTLVTDDDGTVLVALHAWGAHEHPTLTDPDAATPGNGLLLFFRVDDWEATHARAWKLVKNLEEPPHRNDSTGTMEFSLRDPDGYYVSVSAT